MEDQSQKARARLTRVFKFLKQLNDLRNPVPRDLSGYAAVIHPDTWPTHPCISVRRGDRADDNAADSVDANIEPVIRIQRADLTQCPKPPAALDGWLKRGWEFANAAVDVLQSRIFTDRDQRTVTEAFSDSPDRVSALQAWEIARRKWAEAERPAIAARAVFEQIHALWTAMQREGDRVELMLADGMLYMTAQSIRHPVLLQRVSLEFDPSKPELYFTTGMEKVGLLSALLTQVSGVQAQLIGQFDRELESESVEPFGGETTDGFLRRLVQGLFTDGEFLGTERDSASVAGPGIRREAVIFMRPRTAGLATTLDQVVEDLQDEKKATPEGLARIVGVESINTEASPGPSDSHNPGDPQTLPDILFSKPTNAEQYEIAARLARSKAVLVQGPPGTGKTYTIANLLGSLLAQKKTVLVTAHTTKALRVLRGQVDGALQPLCLSVLDSDTENRDQLSQAAQDIANRLSSSNADALRREADSLRSRRKKLLNDAEVLKRKLRDARYSEIEELVVGGQGIRPVEAAKRVTDGAERDGWIPGPLQPGMSCPLSTQEVRQLYSTQVTLAPPDEAQLAVPQPAVAKLRLPEDFKHMAAEQAAADQRVQKHLPQFWNESPTAAVTAEGLQRLQQGVREAANFLSEKQTWLREVLFAGWVGGDHRGTWEDLLKEIDALVAQAAAARRLINKYDPAMPKVSVDETVETLNAIMEHIQSRGSLAWWTRLSKPRWHKLIKSCQVEGRSPKTIEEFRSLHARAHLWKSRDRLARRWQRMVEKLKGPSGLGPAPERAAKIHAEEIRKRLGWRLTVWEPLVTGLHGAGLDWNAWLTTHPAESVVHGEISRLQRACSQSLIDLIGGKAALSRKQELTVALTSQSTYLAGFKQSAFASMLVAVQDAWDAKSYDEAYRDLARLEGLRDTFNTRQSLLAKLKTAASEWESVIRQRKEPHDGGEPPGEPEAAWRWRQWHEELERRASISISGLQEQLSKTEEDLRRLAPQIIERETWAAQCERVGLSERQALIGYVQTIHKIGKGTGKQAPQLLRKARELLASARRAVPVWIMPLSRVYESFDPRDTKFDVVIIDEASQSDATALTALYLGREHVVVGDKEQVTPDAVGQDVANVQTLISQFLQGIPNDFLYDGQTSIYDLAEQSFGGVLALREHFRCVPEIIQFSNHLSYNNTIKPLREPTSVRPAVVAHRVNGHREMGGKTNPVEAETIASLVVAYLNDAECKRNESEFPTSIGVISLLGDEQALLIESILRRRLPPDAFVTHRLLCGNAAQFQGDERDVIFLSMVDGPPEDGTLALRDSGPKNLYKKRYNVAASRARNQLWVVHSVDPDVHLKAGDLRRRLIEHARDPSALMREMEEKSGEVESEFEKRVLQCLLSAGYRVHTQWPVGAYRIDLVVEGKSRRLAVECDGERWHTQDQLAKDMERQANLERLGNVFVRIRGSAFFRDPESAMKPVFAKLDQLGIEPLGVKEVQSEQGTPLLDRIRRNAETILLAWRNGEGR